MNTSNLAFILNACVSNLITHDSVKHLKKYLELHVLRKGHSATQDTIALSLMSLCNELIILENNQRLSAAFDKVDNQKDNDLEGV